MVGVGVYGVGLGKGRSKSMIQYEVGFQVGRGGVVG